MYIKHSDTVINKCALNPVVRQKDPKETRLNICHTQETHDSTPPGFGKSVNESMDRQRVNGKVWKDGDIIGYCSSTKGVL